MELPFTNYQNVRFSTDSKNRQILLSLTKYARIYSERKMKFCYPRGRHVKFCCSAQSSVHNRQVFVRARVSSERFRFFRLYRRSYECVTNASLSWAGRVYLMTCSKRAMAHQLLYFLSILATVPYLYECATGRRLGKFISHYEPLYYDPSSLHNVHRRAVESHSNGKFAFSAFGKFHRLKLRPDRDIFTGDAKFLTGDGKSIPFDRDAVVRGHVEGIPGSDVYGVIDKQDGFHGKILSGTESYYVDPSSWYFDEKQDFPSVIYKDRDLEYHHDFSDIKEKVPSIQVPERARRSLSTQGKNRVRRQTEDYRKNVCTLGLYADNFFTELFGGKTKAIFQLVKQVQAAQIIYMNEFNTTDYYSPYGITFRVKTVVAFDNKDDKLPVELPAQVKDKNVGIDTLLDYFSTMNHESVCEAFLFTDRDFEGGILGLAWIGDGDGNAAGGICDKHNDYNGKKRSYNTGVVTMKLYGRFTPPRISEITFAHELGHGFGSEVSFRVF